mgnify:CR=1 FL=1
MIVFTIDLIDLIMYGLGVIFLIGIGLYILISKLIDRQNLLKNYDIKIEGLCWMQGESDSFHQEFAIQYEEHLNNFIVDTPKSSEIKSSCFCILHGMFLD